jgi:hypothetical protein
VGALLVTQACSSGVSVGGGAGAGQGGFAGSAGSAGTSSGGHAGTVSSGGHAGASGGSAGGNAGVNGSGGASGNTGVSGSAGHGASGSAGASGAGTSGSAGTSGAGTSGSGGVSGSAGEGGTGDGGMAGADTGPICAVPEETAPALAEAMCGAALCGNGVIDHCEYGGYVPVSESCEGTVGIGPNCNQLGFASGNTTCLPTCYFDRTACEDCISSPSLAACARPVQGKSLATFASLASNGTELGLAWVTTPNYVYGSEPGALRFARLKPDLSVIAESSCLPVSGVTSAHVYAVKGGWWLLSTLTDFTDTLLTRLDAKGRLVGSRTITGNSHPSLVVRPDGGALLLYFAGPINNANKSALWATLLDESGTDQKPPVELLAGADSYSDISGAFLNDRYLVSATDLDASSAANLKLISVDASANIAVTATTSGVESQLAWNGQKGLLAFRAAKPGSSAPVEYGILTQSFDATGKLLGSATFLPNSDIPNFGPVLAQGTEWLLVDHYKASIPQDAPYADHLFVTRLDATGAKKSEPQQLDQQPEILRPAAAPRGGDVYLSVLGRSNTDYLSAAETRVTVIHAKPQ